MIVMIFFTGADKSFVLFESWVEDDEERLLDCSFKQHLGYTILNEKRLQSKSSNFPECAATIGATTNGYAAGCGSQPVSGQLCETDGSRHFRSGKFRGSYSVFTIFLDLEACSKMVIVRNPPLIRQLVLCAWLCSMRVA